MNKRITRELNRISKSVPKELKDNIFKAIDEKVKSDGGVNGSILADAMQNLRDRFSQNLMRCHRSHMWYQPFLAS